MTTEPVVSVIVPVYNREHHLVEAVSSVLAQTYPAIECIVVDDGSTDGTLATLAAAFSGDPRVRAFARDHGGVSAARNHGLAQATGEYVTFLDSDDLMIDCRVERQIAFLHEADVDAVLCRERQLVVGDATRPAWMASRPEWWDGYYHMSLLTSLERVRRLGGFDESMMIGEDIDLVIRLVGDGVRIGKLDDQLVVRRFLGDNLTHYAQGDPRVMFGSVRRHRARQRGSRNDPSSA